VEVDRLNPTIKYFPKQILPVEAKQRFQELFKVRSKWNKAEILPYIDDLAGNLKELEPLIIKYCRISRQGENTFCSSRVGSYGK
jgi:sister chromatid cohesion protein DCC1